MKYQTILFFILIATIFSAVLAFSETQLLCGIDDGCTVVQSSSYSNFFGIENAVIGLFAFIIVGILIFSHIIKPKKIKKKLITFGIITGSLIAFYFIYLQFFVIKAICKYCIVVDAAIIIGALLIIFWKEDKIITSQ